MDLSSLLGAIAISLAAALLFQFLCYVAVATLVWAPPAYAGIVAGWWVFQWTASVEASIATAVAANLIVRVAIVQIVSTAVRHLDSSSLSDPK